MAATARVVVLMEETEKVELEARARASKQSVGAYIRSKALDTGDGELAKLLPLVKQSTAAATKALNHALDAVAASMAQAEIREAKAVRSAQQEFKEMRPAGLAALVAGVTSNTQTQGVPQ